MEKETELQVSRKPRENGGVQLKPLQPLPLGKVLFKLPQPDDDDEDDDGNDCISLKEWQPKETRASSGDPNGTSYSAWQPVKEKDSSPKNSVRSRPIAYAPLVKSNGDVCLPPDAHPKLPSEEIDEREDQQEDDHGNGTYNGEEDLEEKPETESTNHVTEPEDVDSRPKVSHHHHSISLANGIAPPPTSGGTTPAPTHSTSGGIAFDITLDDHESSQSRRSTGSSRGSSLRVSFINDVMLDSPSPPRNTNNKSPFRSRPNHSKSPAKSKPSWESSTKIGKSAPPMPKKFVRPTLHGIKVKKGQGGVAKTALRASTSAIENGFNAREGRPMREAVTRSWDSRYLGGGDYDSVSQLISRSLVSSAEDNKSKQDSSKPGHPALPRSKGVRKNDDHDSQNGSEALKPALPGGDRETNKLTGDFGKLFSKLRRASAPLSKPPSKQPPAVHPKPSSAPLISKISRANSAPIENPKPTAKKSLAPLHSLDSSGANQKYAIGSYASLKLLQECAQTEKITPTPTYNVHKPRKIRDHEPHRHYYKTISKTLDSKLNMEVIRAKVDLETASGHYFYEPTCQFTSVAPQDLEFLMANTDDLLSDFKTTLKVTRATWRSTLEVPQLNLAAAVLLLSDVLLQDNSQMEKCEGLGANDTLSIPSLCHLIL